MVVHQNITNLAGYFHFLNVRKIPYVIGKSKMAKQIINYMPEHTCYVEPFACCVGSFL